MPYDTEINFSVSEIYFSLFQTATTENERDDKACV